MLKKTAVIVRPIEMGEDRVVTSITKASSETGVPLGTITIACNKAKISQKPEPAGGVYSFKRVDDFEPVRSFQHKFLVVTKGKKESLCRNRVEAQKRLAELREGVVTLYGIDRAIRKKQDPKVNYEVRVATASDIERLSKKYNGTKK
ncbi:hypothetical protein WDW86_05645 [Bdellovibrionota bacterium FG-2]